MMSAYNKNQRVGFWMKILAAKMEAQMNSKLKDVDITATQLGIMEYILTHPNHSQIVDISEYFNVKHTSVLHVMRLLEKKKCIYRQDMKIGRGKHICLTEKGEQLVEKYKYKIDEAEKELFNGISEKDLNNLLRLLGIFQKNLESAVKQSHES